MTKPDIKCSLQSYMQTFDGEPHFLRSKLQKKMPW